MKKQASTVSTILGLMLVFLASGLLYRLHAQLAVTTATLSGTVSDSTGAVVPNAALTLTSTEKGVRRSYTSDANGHYSFDQLPPSTYTLVITVQGFKEYRQNGIVLDAGHSAAQNVQLSIGSSAQEVVVTSQASVLNTDNANISTDINAKQVVALPLNLRNVIGLTALNSSVTQGSLYQTMMGGGAAYGDSADQDISFFNFAGGFFGTTAYIVDGTWDTASDWGSVIYVPSVDGVEEMKVQNNSFTAQYGWSTGNVINVVTKSGTSAFHGSAYEFYRNSALDANLWFNNYNGLPKSSFTRNQGGISAGGPLYIPGLYRQREKTFIFGLYENLTLSTPLLGTFSVPDANFRAGNFGELLGAQVGTDGLGRAIRSGQIYNPHSTRAITAGQVDPSTGLVATKTGYIRDPIANNNVATLGAFDAVGAKLIGYYPTATRSGLTNNLEATGTAPANSNELMVRVDHNFTDASRLFVRYAYKPEQETETPEYWGKSNPAGPGNIRPNNRYSIMIGFSHIFDPTLTMNLSVGYNHYFEPSTNQSYGFQPSTLGLPAALNTHSPEFPIVTVGGDSQLGPTSGENVVVRPAGSISADFIKTLGRHTLSFGFMGVDGIYNVGGITQTTLTFNGTFTDGPDPNNPTANTGNGVAQTLLGVLDGGSTGTRFNPAIVKHYLGGYLQDDWKPIPKLTLNLGIRYEVQTAPTYRHNSAAYFNPNLPNPIGASMGETLPGSLVFLSSGNRASYNTNYENVAPRIGFSYQALPKLVVRGGYGVFYPPSLYLPGASTDGYGSTTAIVTSYDGITPNPAISTANPWPTGFMPITGNTLGGLQDVGYATASNFLNRHSSYVQQYMFGFQYAFSSNDSLDVSYIGNHGTHMLGGNLNQSQLNPSYLPLGATALNTLVANPYYGHITPGASSCGLDKSTIIYAHLLEPFPQYCGVTLNQPAIGFSLYNALQANFNHRFNNGVSLLVSYTYSKFIDNVSGPTTTNYAYIGSSSPANNYNLAGEKSVDGNDIPNSVVVSYIYALPFGRGKRFASNMNPLLNSVAGGWQVSGISTFKQGFPLAISGNDINSFGGTPRPNVTGNTHVAKPSIKEWFNTSAFSYASYGTFGTVPRYFSDLRAPGYQNWDLSIMKNWGLPKEMQFQFRAEMYNAFNHAQFYAPNEKYAGCDPNAGGACNSSFGQITFSFPGRDVQFAGKLYW
jgi:Carboxypeptidase regulatory-like domain/TonB dependent receptor